MREEGICGDNRDMRTWDEMRWDEVRWDEMTSSHRIDKLKLAFVALGLVIGISLYGFAPWTPRLCDFDNIIANWEFTNWRPPSLRGSNDGIAIKITITNRYFQTRIGNKMGTRQASSMNELGTRDRDVAEKEIAWKRLEVGLNASIIGISLWFGTWEEGKRKRDHDHDHYYCHWYCYYHNHYHSLRLAVKSCKQLDWRSLNSPLLSNKKLFLLTRLNSLTMMMMIWGSQG